MSKRFRVMIRDDETQGTYDLCWFLMKMDERLKSLEKAVSEMRDYEDVTPE